MSLTKYRVNRMLLIGVPRRTSGPFRQFIGMLVMMAEAIGRHGGICAKVVLSRNGHVSRDALAIDADGGGRRKEGVCRLCQLSGPNDAIRTKEAMTVASIQPPRVAVGDIGFPECMYCVAHGVMNLNLSVVSG